MFKCNSINGRSTENRTQLCLQCLCVQKCVKTRNNNRVSVKLAPFFRVDTIEVYLPSSFSHFPLYDCGVFVAKVYGREHYLYNKVSISAFIHSLRICVLTASELLTIADQITFSNFW